MTFKKSASQVKEQIEHWFLSYHKKQKSAFNGTERFTLFNHLHYEKQNELIRKLSLNNYEIPVLVLFIRPDEFIINTTERFIHLKNKNTAEILYKDFAAHEGYKSIAVKTEPGKLVGIKTENELADFGFRTLNGEIIYWTIPTGKPGFAFWNVTDKCSLIGKKYIISDYL